MGADRPTATTTGESTMNVSQAVAFALLVSVLATTASAQTRDIRETDFGEAWPFTVSGGELRCSGRAL